MDWNILSILAIVFLILQVLTSLAIIWRFRRGNIRTSIQKIEPITLIRPFCGAEHRLEECLRSSFSTLADVQIIFCVTDKNDPAIPIVEALIKEYPNADAQLQIGDINISGNPKLNNMAGAYELVKHNWVLMVDSNVILPADYVEQSFANWDESAGLVSSPAQALDLQNIAAHFEATFLNTNQARLQLFADEMGSGFTQGKFIFWKKEILEAGGGLAALGEDLAEDVASTKLIRKQNLSIRLLNKPVPQPLGVRDLRTVWMRQVRWARVRRVGVPLIYVGEIFNGAFVPVLFLLLSGTGMAFIMLFLAIWYGAEWLLARFADWSRGIKDIVLWALRDLVLPVIWIQGYMGSHFEWRGNHMRKDGDEFLLEEAQGEVVHGEA